MGGEVASARPVSHSSPLASKPATRSPTSTRPPSNSTTIPSRLEEPRKVWRNDSIDANERSETSRAKVGRSDSTRAERSISCSSSSIAVRPTCAAAATRATACSRANRRTCTKEMAYVASTVRATNVKAPRVRVAERPSRRMGET